MELQHQWKISISFCKPYIGTQFDLTQVMTLNKKVKAQLLSLIGHMGIYF